MQYAPVNTICAKCAAEAAPVVSPGSIIAGIVNFQIQATQHPILSYGATLPSGLSLNASTGVITGTLAPGSYSIPISATNVRGTGSNILTAVIPNPVTFTITQTSTGIPIQSLQIALEGGAYANATLGTTYTVYHGFKCKMVNTPGAYMTNSGATNYNTILDLNTSSSLTPTLLAGSEMTLQGNLTDVGNNLNGTIKCNIPIHPNSTIGLNEESSIGQGAYSFNLDLSGNQLDSGSKTANPFMQLFLDAPNEDYNLGTNSMEVVLNF